MSSSDRRDSPRVPAQELSATLRLRYRFARIQATALDFNRHGMSLRIDRPLPAHGAIDLALDFGTIRIEGIVAVIHNCRDLGDGSFRCGVQFRTDAHTQFDRDHTRDALERLEGMLTGIYSDGRAAAAAT